MVDYGAEESDIVLTKAPQFIADGEHGHANFGCGVACDSGWLACFFHKPVADEVPSLLSFIKPGVRRRSTPRDRGDREGAHAAALGIVCLSRQGSSCPRVLP